MSICKLHVGEIIDGETLLALQSAYDPTCTEVEVIIDSMGGSPIEAIKIGDWLKSLGKPVKMLAVKAYSAASILWMYGSDDRDKHPDAVKDWLMWHRPTITLEGVNATETMRYLAVLQMVEERMTDVYSTETGLAVEDVQKLMADETYFDDTLAKRYQVLALVASPNEEEQLTPTDMSLLKEIKDSIDKLSGKIKAEYTVEIETPEEGEETMDMLRDKLAEMEGMYKAAMLECEALKATNAGMEKEMPEMLAQLKSLDAKIVAMTTSVKADPKPVIEAKAISPLDRFTAQLKAGSPA